jgi:multicomponent Na+:H+ antiporter subunit C
MIAGLLPYWVCIGLMMTGLYAVIARDNLVKKVMGLSIFQVGVIMFYVVMGQVDGGTAPVLIEGADGKLDTGMVLSNPVPHVLMLTAIVVGVATNALALALVVRVKEAYGTAEEDEILAMDAPGE